MYLRDGSILTESEKYKEISSYFKGFEYCKNGCEIELISCDLGSSQYLKANIENATGCRVKLYERKVNGLFPELNLPWY